MTDLDSLIAEVGERAAFALAFQPDPVEGLRRAHPDPSEDEELIALQRVAAEAWDDEPVGCGDPDCCGEWEWVE